MAQPQPTFATHWCHRCDKRVAVETLPTDPNDVVCSECRNGFVESIPNHTSAPDEDPLGFFGEDHPVDPSLTNQFVHVLRLLAEAAREEYENHDEDDDDRSIELGDNNTRSDDEGFDERGHENPDEDENVTAIDNNNNLDPDSTRVVNVEDEAIRRRLSIERSLSRISRSARSRILALRGSDSYPGNRSDHVGAPGLETLLRNFIESRGRRGAPPASKSAVEGLVSAVVEDEKDETSCAVCKDSVCVGEVKKCLPCGHGYHVDCILPWLGTRNSCPVCRFELPTDDLQYEEDRKRRVVEAGLRAGSSVSNNVVIGGDSLGLE